MRFRTLALCAAALLLAAGCAANKTTSSSTGTTGGSSQPSFILTDFRITVVGTIPAGEVTVKIDNQGIEKHEVVIVAAKDAASLPTKADGSVDEDRIAEADKLGESGDVDPRSSTTKAFTFKPGTYVAFCNIVDDMGTTGSTMMNSGNNTPMNGGQMGNSNSTPMNGGTSGPGMGRVHFALGMHTTFTVS